MPELETLSRLEQRKRIKDLGLVALRAYGIDDAHIAQSLERCAEYLT